jgi:Helix-turn-helix domain
MQKEKATFPEKKAALKAIRDQFKGISASRQCERLLAALASWSINTFEASRYLDVYHCPARVLQLRKQGYKITTHWQTVRVIPPKIHRL